MYKRDYCIPKMLSKNSKVSVREDLVFADLAYGINESIKSKQETARAKRQGIKTYVS